MRNTINRASNLVGLSTGFFVALGTVGMLLANSASAQVGWGNGDRRGGDQVGFPDDNSGYPGGNNVGFGNCYNADRNLNGVLYTGHSTVDLRQLLGLDYSCSGTAIRSITVEAEAEYANFGQLALLVNNYNAGQTQRLSNYRQTVTLTLGYQNTLDQDIRTLGLAIDGNVRVYRVTAQLDQRYPGPGPGYPNPGPGYPNPNPGPGYPDPGYPRPGPGYPNPGNGSDQFLGSVRLDYSGSGGMVYVRNNTAFRQLNLINNGTADLIVDNVEIVFSSGNTQNEYMGSIIHGSRRQINLQSNSGIQSIRVNGQSRNSYSAAQIDIYGN